MKALFIGISVLIDYCVLSYMGNRMFKEPGEMVVALREFLLPDFVSVFFDEFAWHWKQSRKVGLLLLALVVLIVIEIRLYTLFWR